MLRLEPIGRTFWLSFHDWHLIRPLKPWVGLANYRELLQDPNFLMALWNTTLFAVAVVALSVVVGLALAVLLAGKLRFTAAYQAIYFLPVITPMVPMAIAWKWIFDARIGILNYLLSWVGISPVGWLTSPEVAIWSIIIMSVWKVLGYNMVLLLVGLKNIPATLYEAASIDGAFGWRMFRRITLPLLRPILLFVIVVSTINAYNVFTQVYVMTHGLAGGAGGAAARAGLRHLPERLPVLQDGLRLGGGRGADADHPRADAGPVPRHPGRRGVSAMPVRRARETWWRRTGVPLLDPRWSSWPAAS